MYSTHDHLGVEAYIDADWAGLKTDGRAINQILYHDGWKSSVLEEQEAALVFRSSSIVEY